MGALSWDGTVHTGRVDNSTLREAAGMAAKILGGGAVSFERGTPVCSDGSAISSPWEGTAHTNVSWEGTVHTGRADSSPESLSSSSSGAACPPVGAC